MGLSKTELIFFSILATVVVLFLSKYVATMFNTFLDSWLTKDRNAPDLDTMIKRKEQELLRQTRTQSLRPREKKDLQNPILEYYQDQSEQNDEYREIAEALAHCQWDAQELTNKLKEKFSEIFQNQALWGSGVEAFSLIQTESYWPRERRKNPYTWDELALLCWCHYLQLNRHEIKRQPCRLGIAGALMNRSPKLVHQVWSDYLNHFKGASESLIGDEESLTFALEKWKNDFVFMRMPATRWKSELLELDSLYKQIFIPVDILNKEKNTNLYYEVLRVRSSDSAQHKKKQYKKMAMIYHPDKIDFKLIPEAYHEQYSRVMSEYFALINEAYQKIK